MENNSEIGVVIILMQYITSLFFNIEYSTVLKQFFILAILLTGLFLPLSAEHLVGGEITYTCLGSDPLGNVDYRIRLEVYKDCRPGINDFDPVISVYVFDGGTNVTTSILQINQGNTLVLPITSTDTCVDPPTNICYSRAVYQTDVTLPPNPNGYQISWSRCCRNQTIVNIVNPGTQGMVLTTSIPNTAICNSSPRFNNLAPTFLCLLDNFEFDHSATDPDGDMLVYSLTTPFTAGSVTDPVPISTPPPYQNVFYQPPYSLTNLMGGNPGMSINPVTGILSARPDAIGQFVMSVSVFEYRNGVLLSEVKRDIQMNVIDCPINFPPEIAVVPGAQVQGDTLVFFAGEESCFPIQITDVNGSGLPADNLTVTAMGDIMGGGVILPPYATFPPQTGLSPISGELCWTPSCDQLVSSSQVTFRAVDNNDCPGPNVTDFTMRVQVLPGSATPPDLRCVSVEDPTRIRLGWKNPDPSKLNGFDAYYIYRNGGSGWTQIATITDASVDTYLDATVSNANSKVYCYRLSTAKICPTFFIGERGNEVCSILSDAVYVSQVQSLVNWDAYQGWPNPEYTVLADNGSEFEVASGISNTEYVFTACSFQGDFRVRVTDPETGCVAYSGRSPMVTQEDQLPEKRDICRATVESGDSAILVEWEMATEDDFESYRLFRRPADQPGFTEIFSSTDPAVVSFMDTAVEVDANSYCYRLEVRDFCENAISSSRHCTVLLTGEGKSTDYSLRLEWSPYQGFPGGLLSNELWTTNPDAGDGLITSFGPGTLSYDDIEVQDDQPVYCFRIRATEAGPGCGVDSWSNEVCLSFPPVLYLPNAFSPNDDNINDRFEISGAFLKEFHLLIFNRWGKLVYESSSVNDPWDGTYNGRPVPEGVYVYSIEVEGYEGEYFQRSGSITLMR
jgi:gliding motility-associated-like protein